MIPWATIVSLGAQFVGQGLSALNNKKQQQKSDADAARSEAYYNAKAAENPLSRSESAAAIGQFDRDAKKQVENAQSLSAITGATPEYALGVQKAVAEGRADLMSGISTSASRRADKYEDAAEAVRRQKAADDQQRLAARQTTYANLVQNAGKAFGAMMDAYKVGSPNEEVDVQALKESAMSPEQQAQNAQRAATSMAPTIQQAKDKIGPDSKYLYER